MSSFDYQTYVYKESHWKEVCDCDFLLDEPADVHEYDDAIVEPLRYIPGTSKRYGDGLLEGGLCSEEFEFLAGLHRSADGKPVNKSCLSSYEVSEEELEFSDETVIFGGLITSHFGHMLCDGMTRLWYLASHPEDTAKVVFVVYPKQAFPYWELLELAGIDRERVLIVTRPTKFAHVIVPDETSFSRGRVGYKQEWKLVLDKIRSSVEPSQHKKIYFTRSQLANNGGCVGEDYFEDFFRANGFYVVAPETLPFREQVALVVGADDFACTMGSIAHQVMFARAGTRQIVLNRSYSRAVAAPLMNAVSGASLTLVDVYKNILPDSQGGASCWLLAPTPCWDRFLQANPEYQIADPPAYPLEENVFRYICRWGERYGDRPNSYRWIKASSVVDIIARINLYLRDVEIDKTAYCEPLAVERLRGTVSQLEKEAGRVQEVDLQLDNDELVASGSTFLPLSDPDELVIQLEFCPEDDERNAADDLKIPAVVTGDDEGAVTWCVHLPLKDLREAAQDGGDEHRWRLSLEISVGDRSITPRLVPTEAARQRVFLSDSLPQGSALRTDSGAGQQLRLVLVSYEDLLSDVEAGYQIHDLCWEDDKLHMRGILDHPLCGVAGFTCRLACVRESDQRTVTYPLTCTQSSQPDCLVWTAEVDPLSLAKDFYNAGAEVWRLNLDLSIGDRSRSIPFGRKRPVGMSEQYRKHVAECQGVYLLPIQVSKKNFGFKAVSREELVQRPLLNRIETLAWSDDVLKLNGYTEHPLLQDEPNTLIVRLRSETGWHFDVPVRWGYDLDTNTCRWEVEFNPKEMIADLSGLDAGGPLCCFFTVFVKFEDFKLKGPLGSRRSPAPFAAYQARVVTSDGLRFVPIQNQKQRLGFRIESAYSEGNAKKTI